MQRYMTIKYTSLLLGLITLFGVFHGMVIGPILAMLFEETLSQMIQTMSLFIIEPIICIFIMVIFINRHEKKVYDSIF